MRSPVAALALPLLFAIALGACGDELSLEPASIENRVDTVTIYAVNGTPIHQPSGYIISSRLAVRTDFTSSFDFLYTIDGAGKRSFVPIAVLTRSTQSAGNPGFLPTATEFDAITVAEQVGYVTSDSIEATVGQVYYARSAVSGSCFLGTPYYAKLQVLSVDDPTRSVTFQILTNLNCGYRGLEKGLPRR